jgi:hypothetical protein
MPAACRNILHLETAGLLNLRPSSVFSMEFGVRIFDRFAALIGPAPPPAVGLGKPQQAVIIIEITSGTSFA